MLKIAFVQAAPVFMNLEASLARAVEFIAEAAKQGAKLIVFGETWLPCYPAWLDYCPGAALWDHAPTKEVFAELRRNSLSKSRTAWSGIRLSFTETGDLVSEL